MAETPGGEHDPGGLSPPEAQGGPGPPPPIGSIAHAGGGAVPFYDVHPGRYIPTSLHRMQYSGGMPQGGGW